MNQASEELLKSNLEEGETILWTGRADAAKPISTTNRGMCLASLIVSSVIAVFFISKMILSAAQSGGSISIAFILLVLGAAALLPGGVIGDGFRARKLSYAATDRRLIIISKSNFNSMFYRCIHDAAFMRDSDGKVSLLCGKTALASKPWRWRDLATRNGSFLNEKGVCDAFILYAVDDADGLKKAVSGRLTAV